MQLIGKKHKTDKITHHKYHEFYPTYIEKFYEKSGGIIEVGLDPKNGKASLHMWLDLFPNMHIYGLDRDTPNEFKDKYTILQCDQSDPDQLNNCIDNINNSIYFINDDGSHIPEHQLLTFNKLFPLLEVGGVYIIEDIETSYWTKGSLYGYQTRYGKGHEKSIVEIFKKSIDGVNVEFSKSFQGEVQYQREIGSITFAKNCIIITKRISDNRPYRFESAL
jgi:hypothetical protein